MNLFMINILLLLQVPNQAMTPTASGDYSLVSQNGQNSGVPCYASSLLRDEWGIISRVAVASIGSQGTMGGLLVAGFVSCNR